MKIKAATFQSQLGEHEFASYRELFNFLVENDLKFKSEAPRAYMSRQQARMNILLNFFEANVDAPPQYAYFGHHGCVLIGKDAEDHRETQNRPLIRLDADDTLGRHFYGYSVQHWGTKAKPFQSKNPRAIAHKTVRLMRELWNVDARLKPRFWLR